MRKNTLLNLRVRQLVNGEFVSERAITLLGLRVGYELIAATDMGVAISLRNSLSTTINYELSIKYHQGSVKTEAEAIDRCVTYASQVGVSRMKIRRYAQVCTSATPHRVMYNLQEVCND